VSDLARSVHLDFRLDGDRGLVACGDRRKAMTDTTPHPNRVTCGSCKVTKAYRIRLEELGARRD
jgi:hypothetical protein